MGINLKENDILPLLVRLFVGGVFIYASIDKIMHPHGFAELVNNYHILPPYLVNLMAIFLPWLEMV